MVKAQSDVTDENPTFDQLLALLKLPSQNDEVDKIKNLVTKNTLRTEENVSFPYRRILKLKTDGRICPN